MVTSANSDAQHTVDELLWSAARVIIACVMVGAARRCWSYICTSAVPDRSLSARQSHTWPSSAYHPVIYGQLRARAVDVSVLAPSANHMRINRPVDPRQFRVKCSLSLTTVKPLLYLRTQLVKNGCTYCEKYLYRDMDFHRLTCEVVWLVNDLPKKLQIFVKPTLHYYDTLTYYEDKAVN